LYICHRFVEKQIGFTIYTTFYIGKCFGCELKSFIPMENLQMATLGGGCFWCIENIFASLRGVHKAVSGYSGGTGSPTYKAVCGGQTGHAEVVNVHFDPQVIDYEDLLRIFFHIHDPTTLNRQGADVGTQYRSVIFFHDAAQQQSAEKIIAEMEKKGLWKGTILTEVCNFTRFFPAEDYHQDYFNLNGFAPYCQMVIAPKVKKFRQAFKDKLKTNL
jgi:peptide-methionine (S)-S-oxide reductase